MKRQISRQPTMWALTIDWRLKAFFKLGLEKNSSGAIGPFYALSDKKEIFFRKNRKIVGISIVGGLLPLTGPFVLRKEKITMSKKRRRVSNKARSKNKEPEKKRKRKTGGELGESIPDIGWSKDDELRLVDDGVFQEAIKQFGKDFLKAIVEPILGHPITIKDFIPQKPVKVPANSYQPRLDCFIRLEPRGVIGLEVQRKVGKNLGQRMIQYQAALFSENAEKRLDDYDFQPTITIWVCEFDYFKAGKSLYPMVIKSESNADDYALPGVFRIHIFNLKAKEFINKGQEDLAHDMLCDQPSQMHSKTLADALSYIQKSKRKEAEKNSMEIYERGRADGKAEGRIEGEAEGRIEGKAEIIRALYRNGMAIETIAQYTNLSVEEVLRIVERGASDA